MRSLRWFHERALVRVRVEESKAVESQMVKGQALVLPPSLATHIPTALRAINLDGPERGREESKVREGDVGGVGDIESVRAHLFTYVRRRRSGCGFEEERARVMVVEPLRRTVQERSLSFEVELAFPFLVAVPALAFFGPYYLYKWRSARIFLAFFRGRSVSWR